MRRLLIIIIIVVAALAPVHAAWPAEGDEVVPVDGRPWQGQPVRSNADGQLTFFSQGITRKLDVRNLVVWGEPVDPSPRSVVISPDDRRFPACHLLLADSGRLVVGIDRADGDELAAYSELFGKLSFSLGSLAGIVFDVAHDRATRDAREDEIRQSDARSDRLWTTDGDVLEGTFRGVDVAEPSRQATVRFTSNFGELAVPLSRVEAVAFNPALVERSRRVGFHMRIGFDDGSELVARSLVTALEGDMDASRLELATGGTWRFREGAFSRLTWIQPIGARVTYLSDLKPEGYRHVPFLRRSWPFREDRNVLGGRLRLDGRPYAKGLGMHSASRLTYPLDGAFRRFDAEIGIDDDAADGGDVTFRVFVDGRQQYASPPVRGGEPARSISVDVSGARRMSLIVDYGRRGSELDYADWLSARLVR